MNSLEFVDDRIRSYETMLLTAIDTKCSEEQIKYYEEKLNIFRQIKAELEAWEVVKPSINEIKGQCCVVIHNVFRDKYYQIIKKALEVEDE